jgi:ATP-binding cassette, subfamily B, bacterial
MTKSEKSVSLSAAVIILRKYFTLILAHERSLVVRYLCSAVAIGVLPVIGAYIAQWFVDSVTGSSVGEGASPYQRIGWILILLMVARYFVGFVTRVLNDVVAQTYLDYTLRNRLQMLFGYLFNEKLVHLDVQLHEDPEVRSLISLTNQTYQWRTVDVVRLSAYALTSFGELVAALLVLLPFGWKYFVLYTIVAIPRFIARKSYGVLNWSMFGSGAPHIKKFWYFSSLLSSDKTVPELQIFGSERALLAKYKHIQEYLYSLAQAPLRTFLRISWIPVIIESVALLGASLFLLPRLGKSISLGEMLLFLAVSEQYLRGISGLFQFAGQMMEDSLFVGHFFDVLELPQRIQDKENALNLSKAEVPTISFQDVSFSYPNGKEVLHKVSFTVKAGQSVALVGVNGAGKSTIVKLLCRFYDPSSGEVLINGVPLTDVNKSSWYSCLGTLFQKFVDFHFTVRENIQLGASDIKDDERMRQAARDAGIEADIVRLPQGYDSYLGTEFEDGHEFSWGQWQKLAIARAFYRQTPVLIMDEPTSAVDAEAEAEIFESLRKYYKEKTLIFVSHRFSTVRNADHIFVIDDGRILEDGTHTELMANNGKYKSMFLAQARGYQ